MNSGSVYLLILSYAALFVTAVVAAVAANALSSRRNRSLGAEPHCRNCGYIVHHGANRVCPECGRDLRAVGVCSASIPTPLSIAPAALLMGLFLALLAIFAAVSLAKTFPLIGRYQIITGLSAIENPQTSEHSKHSVTLRSSGERTLWTHHPNRLTLSLYQRYKTFDAYDEALWVKGRWNYKPAASRGATTIPTQTTTTGEFLAEYGVDPRSDAGAILHDWTQRTLAGHLDGVADLNWYEPQVGVLMGDVYYHPSGTFIVGLAVLFWTVPMVLIIRWFVRLRRRRGVLVEEQSQLALDRVGVEK